MSYQRLEQLDGLQWPCPTEDHPGSPILHDRLWSDPVGGTPAPFMPVEFEPPIDTLTADFPMRLTTGRRLDSFNTGVQTGGYSSLRRRG
jgi:predicted molibdopterin-dependent oxidoreductase YjgC